MEEQEWNMRVKSITKTEKQDKNGNVTLYRVVARDKDGLNELTLTSAYPFKGLNAKEGIFQVVLKNSQMTIDDFEKKED